MIADLADTEFSSATETNPIPANIPAEFTDAIIKDIIKSLLPAHELYRIKSNPASVHHFPRFNESEYSDDSDDDQKLSAFECHHYGCAANFSDPYVMLTHNTIMHHLKCCECGRIFPTGHILDMHISEQHDSMFAVKLERCHAMYACLLKTCDANFGTPQQRKEHCIKEHHFPGHFRFFQLSDRVLKWSIAPKVETPQPDKEDGMDVVIEDEKNTKNKGKKKNNNNLVNKQQPVIKEKEAMAMDTRDNVRMSVKENIDETMAVNEMNKQKPAIEKNSQNVFRNFSFGHQRMKTFHSQGKPRNNKDAGKTLQDFSALKNALDENM